MPVWRCPHCATPQAETARCWVCRRSTTSCVTCRWYRRGVATGLGLCGLDPARPVVTETEVQPCWVAAPTPVEEPAERRAPWIPGLDPGGGGRGARSPRTFVPVEELAPARVAQPAVAVLDAPAPDAVPAIDAAPAPVPARVPAPDTARPVPGRWWLWGDPDPWPERI